MPVCISRKIGSHQGFNLSYCSILTTDDKGVLSGTCMLYLVHLSKLADSCSMDKQESCVVKKNFKSFKKLLHL